MRFRLRTLLVVFVLLCVSAPWWDDIARNRMSPQLRDAVSAYRSRIGDYPEEYSSNERSPLATK
jgi:hypothetical protein